MPYRRGLIVICMYSSTTPIVQSWFYTYMYNVYVWRIMSRVSVNANGKSFVSRVRQKYKGLREMLDSKIFLNKRPRAGESRVWKLFVLLLMKKLLWFFIAWSLKWNDIILNFLRRIESVWNVNEIFIYSTITRAAFFSFAFFLVIPIFNCCLAFSMHSNEYAKTRFNFSSPQSLSQFRRGVTNEIVSHTRMGLTWTKFLRVLSCTTDFFAVVI